ncbi:MAG: dihydropteroate synthase [Mycobacteriales bacterium]|nr:dihydropteroate synthase [Mycobacteriales bacterium]
MSVRGFADLGRTRVMGVVNATPDSFSDGGDHATVDAAVAHGLALVAEGADLVDVGGESTRPGAARVDADEELARVLPVVRGLVDSGVVVSVDTTRAAVAAAALDAGAVLVNDVSAGVADPAMLTLVAERGVPYVATHGRGASADMQTRTAYADVVREVRDELAARLEACWAAGLAPDQVVLDPGLGFAKEADHNWALLRGLDDLASLGRPLLVGASRKRFLGLLLGAGPEALRPPKERDDATTALTVVAAQAGAWAVRVHAVRPSADAVRVVQQLARA